MPKVLSILFGRLDRSGVMPTFSNASTVSLLGKQSLFPREKAKGAFVAESALHSLMAISRILSQHFASKVLGMIIHLFRISPERPAAAGHGATIPEDLAGRLPFLCFVLHRMGFFVPRELLRER